MTMKIMYRVAVTLGLIATSVGSLRAAEITEPVPALTNQIYVMNNHLAPVRVFAEDVSGKLHALGRVPRGQLRTFEVPSDVAAHGFRVKVFPSNPLWLSPVDDYGVKTGVLDFDTDHQITIWLETDLSQSKVEIDRG
jgi:hypothetical protein